MEEARGRRQLRQHEVLDYIIRQIAGLSKELAGLNKRTRKIMATLDDLVAAATDEDTKIDSLIALVVKLKEKIDAIPGITPEQQAKIDAAFAAISDNPERIQAAIDANTPAEDDPEA